MIDQFQVGNAQSQLAGRSDVSRLAKIKVLIRISVELAAVGSQSIRIVIPDRNRSFLAPLFFDGLSSTVSTATGSVPMKRVFAS